MTEKIKSKIDKNFILFVILLLASFLRLYRIGDYMTFLGDEGRDVLVVYNILHGHLTLLGPTSSVGGFFLGPIYYYFMAPFLWLFNYNPVGPAIMVALFGIATVWLVYKFCADLFNYKIGLIAAFLFSISPLVIAYSRSSWNPNPLPFFSLLGFYVLYKGVVNEKLKYFLLAGILLGISMQLHYLAIFLGVAMILFVLLSEIYLKKEPLKLIKDLSKKYLYSFMGFLIGWSPFLAFEVRHGFPDFKSIINFVFHSGNTGPGAGFFEIIANVFFRVFGRLVVSFPPPEQYFHFNPLVLNLWIALTLLVAFCATGVLILYLLRSYGKKDFIKYLLLSDWFFVGIILFGFYKKNIYDYYFSFLFPLPFILTGIFIYKFFSFKRFPLFAKTFSVFIFLALFALNIQGVPFRYQPNRQLNQMETISRFVLSKTGGKPYNFALITGGNSDFAYRYFFTVWGQPPVTIQNSVVDPKRTTVTSQLMVVCESLPCQPLGNSLWEIAGFGRADIAGKWNVSVVQVYRLVHYKGNK